MLLADSPTLFTEKPRSWVFRFLVQYYPHPFRPQIEIIAESPETRSDGEGCQSLADWARNQKRRREVFFGDGVVQRLLYGVLECGVPPFWAETEQGVALAILRGVIDFKREPWPHIC